MNKKNDFMEKMCQAIFRGYELKQKSSKFKALDLRKIYEMDEEGYKPINNTMNRVPTAEEFILKKIRKQRQRGHRTGDDRVCQTSRNSSH